MTDPLLDTPAPGRMLGHYAIQDRLGHGGMGEVLLAVDTRLGRKVALKILPAEFVADEERLSRFEREARVLAALNHPSIVTIYSVEEIGGFHFLAMELVEGQTLRRLIPAAGMELAAFLDLAVPLADALAAAHERGITHRDLKPENLMVTGSGRIKVLDFGLAKRSREQDTSPSAAGATETLTRDGLVFGTVPYMSPEQAQGKPVDERSDVFSLGVIFYEMLSGRRPFNGDSMAEVISAILRDAPSALARNRPGGAPRVIERIVARCLEKDPADRYRGARELHEELSRVKRELDLEVALSSGRRRSGRIGSEWRAPFSGRLLDSRAGLTLLMAGVLAVDFIETSLETWLRASTGLGTDLGFAFARAARWLEGGLSFEAHDLSGGIALYGSSLAYFFLFPLLLLGTGWALWRRAAIAPYRSLALSLVLAYATCLPFYLFCPMPERWAFPESEAVLLSDLWSSRLIEAFRPISGLDNCFPSFHVALSVIVAWLGWVHRLRWRLTLVALASLVILSTFTLGIHWLVDIVAGGAVGIVSVALALRWERSLPGSILTTTRPTLGGLNTL